MKVVNSVEPRIVVPLNFKSDNDPKAAKVEDFLKAIGSSNGTPEEKSNH